MKIALCQYDRPNGPTVRLIPMQPTEHAHSGGFGYLIPKHHDLFPTPTSEYLGISVAMALYEGGEAAGSYPGWSWAVIPESQAEADHLAEMTGRALYR